MGASVNYLWLIPILPLIGFLINGLLGLYMNRYRGRKLDRRFVTVVACGVVLASFILSVMGFVHLQGMEPEQRQVQQHLFHWVTGGPAALTGYAGVLPAGTGNMTIEWTYLLDPLSSVMMLIVCGVGFLIHVFAVGYMWEDTGYYRFFSYLNLFMFSMLTLVMGNNYIMMFLGWEGVGFCSYALIGFYFHKQSASDAGKKAFLVNRVGDYGFTLGVLMIFCVFGSFNFTDVGAAAAKLPVETQFGLVTAICLLLFVGATGKSAQIPLYVWLPDAMEGPTPVSALIHAATMVTAGVYMVTRNNFLFTRAPLALEVVGLIGVCTALFAATMGLFQRDIKKVLAYSTISQLGYMFTGLGVAAFSAGIMHLMTHAFFKALLFLGAGSVIHSMHHEQDMQNMGNLRKYMPVTFGTMMMAYLAICGIPPFAGFFSKDEILWQAFASGHTLFYALGLLAAGCTAFYMTRLMVLTFFSRERIDHHVKEHLHESPKVMTLPLVVLGILSVVGGLLGLPAWMGSNRFETWLEPVFRYAAPRHVGHFSHAFEAGMAGVSVLVALIGIGLGWYLYQKKAIEPDREMNWGRIWEVVYNKYYVDELYDAVIVRNCMRIGNVFCSFDTRVVDGAVNGSAALTRGVAIVSGWFDRVFVDGLVNLQAWIVQNLSAVLRRLQTGVVHNYALAVVLGVVALACVYIFR